MADEAENRAVIEKLKAETPALAVRTRKSRILDLTRNICALIAIVAIGIALYANYRTSSVGTCVNDNLGTRNGPVAADTQAHLDFASLLSRIVSMTKEQQKAQAVQIKTQIRAYADTLKRDQAERTANPLGKC